MQYARGGNAMRTLHKSIHHLRNAVRFSFCGIRAVFQSEIAFRLDLIISLIVFLITIFLPISLIEKGWIISALIFILFAELANTAIETIIDRISTAYHDLSKKAKDIGSALVFLSFINLLIVLICVLFAHVDAFTFH